VKKLLLVFGGLASVTALPLLAVLAVLGVATSALACTAGAGLSLRPDAPVPARALPWIAATRAACPDLPAPWIAAIMAQESSASSRPSPATSTAAPGGSSRSTTASGPPTTAPLVRRPRPQRRLGHQGPAIHARVGGIYLCHRLAGVRAIRAQHPELGLHPRPH
jgi:hypothetical protein